MINAEKYIDELKSLNEADKLWCSAFNKYDMTFGGCLNVKCENCAFNGGKGCNNGRYNWLLSEYKKPIKLIRLEYEILNYILNNTDYRFIVRDYTGKIFILTHEPTKDFKGGYWGVGEGRYENASFLKDLFQFVKWIDDKPTSIKDILDNCIVK